MKFQFSIARLLLATAAFAFVLGIMKPLKLAGHPLVWIAASAVAGIVLIASKDQFRLKGTIAIGLQVIETGMIIAFRYLSGPWDNPIPWDRQNQFLINFLESSIMIFTLPLRLIEGDTVLFVILLVVNCYLWAQCICWIVA
jgi:hypothetical protein